MCPHLATVECVVAGSPQGLQGDGTVLAPQERGWDQAWPGLVRFGGCCHPCHPCGAVLGCCWGVVTASLSPQGGEEQIGWHWGTGTPLGPPSSAVTTKRWAVSSDCPHTEELFVPPPRDTMSLPWHLGDTRMSLLRTPHRLLHRTCTKSVAGDRDAPSLESRWMWRYPGDRGGSASGRALSPTPEGSEVAPAPTLAHAGQGQCELPHEVVAGGAVVVLHHEAHQGQLRHPHLEPQRLLPARVETCGTGRGVGTATGATRATQCPEGPAGPPCTAPAPAEPLRCPGAGRGSGGDAGTTVGCTGEKGSYWGCDGVYWGMGVILGVWGSYWSHDGIYWGKGGHTGARLGYTGRTGVVQRL